MPDFEFEKKGQLRANIWEGRGLVKIVKKKTERSSSTEEESSPDFKQFELGELVGRV